MHGIWKFHVEVVHQRQRNVRKARCTCQTAVLLILTYWFFAVLVAIRRLDGLTDWTDRQTGRTKGRTDEQMEVRDWTNRQTGRSGLMDREDGKTSRWTEGRTDCTKGRTVQRGRMEWRELPDGRTDGRTDRADGRTEQADRDGLDGQREGWVNERKDWKDWRSGHWADGRVCYIFLLNEFLDRCPKIWVISFHFVWENELAC